MANIGRELDVARNIRIIEWLKAELLDNVSGFFRGFLQTSDAVLADYLAHIVVTVYTLARRLGIGYQELDRQVMEKVRISVETGSQGDDGYNDLQSLQSHLNRQGKL